jgi:hypothetical protein
MAIFLELTSAMFLPGVALPLSVCMVCIDSSGRSCHCRGAGMSG